jgi:hypothetical protein
VTEYRCGGGGKADRGEQGETEREGSRVEEALLLAHEGEREKPNEKLSSNIVNAVLFCAKAR